MKSLRIAPALMVFGMVLISCGGSDNDSYICSCNYTDGTSNFSDTNEIGEKSSIADAEVDCQAHRAELLNSGATSADCTVSVK